MLWIYTCLTVILNIYRSVDHFRINAGSPRGNHYLLLPEIYAFLHYARYYATLIPGGRKTR